MTDKEFFDLKSGDKIISSDGILRLVKSIHIAKRDWLGRPKVISFLVAYDVPNSWAEFTYSYSRGTSRYYQDWKVEKGEESGN